MFTLSHPRTYLLILKRKEGGEGGRERERGRLREGERGEGEGKIERERNSNVRGTFISCPSYVPDLGLNPQHVGAQDNAPTNWATKPELPVSFNQCREKALTHLIQDCGHLFYSFSSKSGKLQKIVKIENTVKKVYTYWPPLSQTLLFDHLFNIISDFS